ncbi:hypothetical protein C458_01770 [Haloferax sp. ATCC BAA-644]|nr:hypothetical protein C458_01770 [Haloferax sp. ATCC BAA-644]
MYLYDEFADGVRHRERLEQLVGSNDHLWIVPADVHY